MTNAVFILGDLVLNFWFITFQYYWLPQLQFKHFWLYKVALVVGFEILNVAQVFGPSVLGMLSYVGLFGAEAIVALILRQGRYLPTLVAVSIWSLLLVTFMNVIALDIADRLVGFQQTGGNGSMLVQLVAISLALWLILRGLRPLKNAIVEMIQSFQGTWQGWGFNGFILAFGFAYVAFSQLIPANAQVGQALQFLVAITGLLFLGLGLSLYLLIQGHAQQERTTLQQEQLSTRRQYAAEVNRQIQAVRQFRHDYQNVLLGMGGYLHNHDYAGLRQFYIDVRSAWQTSDAADLTLDDLAPITDPFLRGQLYHEYLKGQQAGVQIFVKVPEPVTTETSLALTISLILADAMAVIVPIAAVSEGRSVTVTMEENAQDRRFSVTFPVTADARVVRSDLWTGGHRVNFNDVFTRVTAQGAASLTVKLHWAQLTVTIPRQVPAANKGPWFQLFHKCQ